MVDHLIIDFIGGKGGDGIVSFHTAKFVPKGPPDGGDGGKGGSVILVGDRNLLTLYDLQNRKRFVAPSGGNGGSKNQHGKNGDDLRISVPLGTQVTNVNTEELRGDITAHEQELVVARGGRGGRGNARFKSSRNRSPKRADAGAPGEEVRIALDLKVIADVGLIGLPNAGKSTLLNALTNATSRIGAHPFTTKEPQLGVMEVKVKSEKVKGKREDEIRGQGSEDRTQNAEDKGGDEVRGQKTDVVPSASDSLSTNSDLLTPKGLILADIPGLIEGAAQGKGLGDQFLRHVERTAVLVHLIDPTVHRVPGTGLPDHSRGAGCLQPCSGRKARSGGDFKG